MFIFKKLFYFSIDMVAKYTQMKAKLKKALQEEFEKKIENYQPTPGGHGLTKTPGGGNTKGRRADSSDSSSGDERKKQDKQDPRKNISIDSI